MTTPAVDVEWVIGVPTHRRPRQLAELLHSLAGELDGAAVLVIVADNDCGTDAPQIVARFQADGCAAACVSVPERGISAVRNALVRQAVARAPGWRYLVMLDDDGTVTPGWFNNLRAAALQIDAHVLAGPVLGQLPASAGLLARNSLFAGRRRRPTGPAAMLNGAQNICIARKLAKILPAPWFRADLGTTGGEDYDFFRQVLQVGGNLGWCDEAIVIEPPTAAQLTATGLLYRYASTGTYMAVIDRRFDGADAAWRQAARGLVGSIARVGLSACLFDRDGVAKGVLSTAYFCGQIGGLAGIRAHRYAPPAPNDHSQGRDTSRMKE